MKTVLIVVGVVALLCCGGGAAVLFFGARQGMSLATEGKQFGDESLQAICSSWSLAELERRAAPELIQQAGKPALKNITDTLSPALGPLKAFKSSIGGFEAKSTTETGTYVQVRYSASCTFEKGNGDVEMTLVQRKGKWEILAFNGQQTK
ncbi:MAG TPA: hypothetical protein VEX38_08090 [Fimbriimonadaceae bacterium]|nr:hypothetical protein [Fimbriimonadaceae bacterium]